jgi:TonB family protein
MQSLHQVLAVTLGILCAAVWAQEPPGSLSTPVQKQDPTVFAEELPPVSRGKLYSAPQIRYCLAESIRIEAVRDVLDKSEPGSVDAFNAKIADFNGRCASYRFYESEMFFVKREVDEHRVRLQADARNEYLKQVAARRAQRAQEPPAPRAGAAEAAASKPPAQAEATASALPEARPEPTQSAVQAGERPAAPTAQPAAPIAPVRASSEPARAAPPVQEPAAAAAPPTPAAPPSVPAAPPPQASTGKAPPASATPQAAEVPTPAPAPAVAPPIEAPPPVEATVPELAQPQPATAPAEERPERPKAAAPADNAVMTRYVKEIQRVGSRVLDDRQVPEAARVKGGSGTAQIEVRFSAGGFIRSIVLAQSSGRAEFDAYALTVARGIMFPHVPKELAARDFTARFPIAFKPRKPR